MQKCDREEKFYDLDMNLINSYIHKILNKYSVNKDHVEYEEVYNIAYDAYFSAIKKFKPELGGMFKSYFYGAISLAVMQYFYNSKRKQNNLKYAVSLHNDTYINGEICNLLDKPSKSIFNSDMVINQDRKYYQTQIDYKIAYQQIIEFIESLRRHELPKSSQRIIKYDELINIYDEIIINSKTITEYAKEIGTSKQVIHKRLLRLKELIIANTNIDMTIFK